jgi:uncharacterized membrane protein SpoIIM required for sporulation
MEHLGFFRLAFRRNKLLIGIMTLAFFSILIVSLIVTYAVLESSPRFVGMIRGLMTSTRAIIGIPPPYTSGLYNLIFLNNIGHFWNPTRMLVWIPFVGAYNLGYELLLNAIVIGAVASFTTLTKSAAYTIAGLTPHGIFEIPAFILEFAALTRWQISTTRALYAKLSGRQVDRPLLVEGIKDTLVLSLVSVVLFAIAAYVETYFTPRLLGL